MPIQKKPTLTPQQKFQSCREDLNGGLIEREEEIDIVLVSLLCQENPLLVGAPGSGKSFLVDSLLRWMNEDGTIKKWGLLFDKFTTPEQVFGMFSIKSLKEDIYKRITTAKLPEAHIGFGDEFMKASSAIRNSMLKILNERVFENADGTTVKCPLMLFLACSNEWKAEGEEEGSAMMDRFLLRKKVHYIRSQKGRRKLVLQRNHKPEFRSFISLEEVQTAQKQVKKMEVSKPAEDAFFEIINKVNDEGITPSDRRIYKSWDVVKAAAYLAGSSMVGKEHLEILSHVLWEDPEEQPSKVQSIITKIALNVDIAFINTKMVEARDVFTKTVPSDAVTKLKDIKKELERLKEEPRRNKALEDCEEMIRISYDKVIGRTTK